VYPSSSHRLCHTAASSRFKVPGFFACISVFTGPDIICSHWLVSCPARFTCGERKGLGNRAHLACPSGMHDACRLKSIIEGFGQRVAHVAALYVANIASA
jgi:hypothetical protein